MSSDVLLVLAYMLTVIVLTSQGKSDSRTEDSATITAKDQPASEIGNVQLSRAGALLAKRLQLKIAIVQDAPAVDGRQLRLPPA